MTIRQALWQGVWFVTWMRRRRRIHSAGLHVRVNLGSGVCVAPGWINVDGNVHALCARWPVTVQRWLHGHSDLRNTHSTAEYLRLLRENEFIHHGLHFGVPFDDGKVDVIFSSHVIEHLFRDEAEALLRDAYRTLKKGGLIRIAVPDLEHAVTLYQ